MVAICGDIAAFPRGALQHPAAAEAGRRGAPDRAPPPCCPAGVERLGVERLPRHARGPDGRRRGDDAAPAARAHERRLHPIRRANIIRFYGLDGEKLKLAKPDALVMHPGPMNRGVEIDSAVADGVAVGDPRAGGDGRGGAHGGARCARPQPARRRQPMMPPQISGDATRRAFVNARLVDPALGLDQPGGLIIADGRIVAAGRAVSPATAGAGTPVIDCRGRLLIPGADRHAGVHRRAGQRAPRDLGRRHRRRRRPAASRP